MAKKLYVGNLPFTCTDNDLMQAFSAYGNVASARVITDRETNRSKGFGFVEMQVDEEAMTAIQNLNGKPLNGRPLTVNEARPREAGGGGRDSYSGGGRRGRGYDARA